MEDLKSFIKSYWEYYLDLEKQFIETKRFVDFDSNNSKTFSVEYLKLYQAVCSEIDVVGKEIAVALNPKFKVKDSNIKKWGYEIQQSFPEIKDIIVCFNESNFIQPFKNWQYEYATSKNGKRNIRVVENKNTIDWWKNYNEVKHQRIGLVTGTKNYYLANQKNLILSFSALFLLETIFLQYLSNSDMSGIQKSNLFSIRS